ncbi:hypothetical protein HCJ58_10075 [Listeria sp. FSL L7-1509]|uniref:Lipoprotein n=1 Tax=Listeria immobilis TaxID=2713502 RepID=A0ABR6SY66_9LIST|nr:hypothetical protein [Listeria immobilis]MBC1481930.1 hypothetical protein [Listeria immobilis]MBC1507305.1 hypothetical protein [Listeria immobilis]MBC1510629.1 hypothetical protein [Listeria immobilis]MBC6301783.1 hypothetical protein [Listeria immobilis]MBC6313165.1 hypothetical protein [Listeria immobilis]
MKKLIFYLLVASCLLVGCTQKSPEPHQPHSFEYGKSVEIDEDGLLQIMEDDKLYLVSDMYSEGASDLGDKVSFKKIPSNLKLTQSQMLPITNLESEDLKLAAFSSSSNPSGEMSVFNVTKEKGIVVGPEKYIPISSNVRKEKGDYIGTGTFTNGENAILFSKRNDKDYTLTRWSKKGKINKEKPLTDIIKDTPFSTDQMTVFQDTIYIYSYKSQKVYVISQDLELLHAWDVGEELKKVPFGDWSTPVQFVQQRELGELFLYNSEKPEQGFYQISDTGVKKLARGQAKYRDMFIVVNGSIFDLFQGKEFSSDYKNIINQMVLTSNGDAYFIGHKDFSNPEKKIDKDKLYLTKINKKSLPAFIKEMNEKNK